MAASDSNLSKEADMSTPRRRLVRPEAPPARRPNPERRVHKLRARLEAERAALARWQVKLRRAFTTVDKRQRAIARIERELARLED
jgi:hypothetical protein